MDSTFHRIPLQQFSNLLQYGVKNVPEKTAVWFGERKISYIQLENNAKCLASAMERAGVVKGEHIGIISPNCIEFIEAVLACAKLGAVAVNINWRYSPEEMIDQLDFNDVHFCFYWIERQEWNRAFRSLCKERIRLVPLMEEKMAEYQAFRNSGNAGGRTHDLQREDTLFHFQTSGTTGRPKTVVITHGAYIDEMNTCASKMGFNEGTIFQTTNQLFHSACIGIYLCLAQGGTVVLFQRYNSEAYLRAIQEKKVTRVSAIPTVLRRILDHSTFTHYDLSSVKMVNYATAPMPEDLISRAIERVPCDFMQSYGMTEMASVVTLLQPEDHWKNGGKYRYSVGRPLPNRRVRIVDEAGRDCSAGMHGEIIISAPSIMKKYYKMPEETQDAIRDGWYYSGDIGYFDEDGYLYVSGWKTDMIISGGENIFPREVENELCAGISEIYESAVFGVHDEEWGEIVCACVVLKDGQRLTAEAIKERCHIFMAGYKIPKKVEIVPMLPRNGAGKIMKSELLCHECFRKR